MIRKLAWPAAYILTTVASFVWIPLTYELPSWIGWVFIASAFFVGLGAPRTSTRSSCAWPRRLTEAAALALAAALLEPPLRLVAILMCAGILLDGFGGVTERFASSARRVGVVGLVEGVTGAVYIRFLANAHEIPALASLDRLLGRLCGLDVATSSGQSFFPGPEGLVAVTPTWDHVAAVFGVVALFGAIAVGLACAVRRPGRQTLAAIAATAAVLIGRRFVLLLVAIELDRPQLFWDPAVTIASLLPLVVLLAWLVHRGREIPRVGHPKRRTRPLLTGFGAFLGACLVLAGTTLCPPGEHRSGTALFDEAHGDWESTLRPLDTEWYGMMSTYNYASLYEWLAYYTPVAQLTTAIDRTSLSGAQVLILKTPSIPYTGDEIDEIAEYVHDGGGLLVIGDHTNVFGSTTVLNPVLRRFGLALRYDSTYDLDTGSFTVVERDVHPADPISLHVKRFDFLTSCSLEPSLRAVPVLRDVQVLANQADYGTRDFFPKERFTHASIFGGVTQAAAAAYGRGRVVVFTDSTCFSNFSMHMDGYGDFVLASLGYLSRANPRLPIRGLLLLVGTVLFCAATCATIRTCEARTTGLALLLAWAITPWAVTELHRAWYPLPEPKTEVPYVYFDVSHSNAIISAQPTVTEASTSRLYETFFVWTQRIGLVPQRVELDDVLVPRRAIVLIDPAATPDDADLDRVVRYVQDGGRLLILGHPGRDATPLAEIAARFGRDLVAAVGGGWEIAEAEVVTHTISPALTLTISAASYGAGQLVLVSDSSPFSDLSLGTSFVVPNDIQTRLNAVEFDLFRHLLDR